jgi:hypothetical protein
VTFTSVRNGSEAAVPCCVVIEHLDSKMPLGRNEQLPKNLPTTGSLQTGDLFTYKFEWGAPIVLNRPRPGHLDTTANHPVPSEARAPADPGAPRRSNPLTVFKAFVAGSPPTVTRGRPFTAVVPLSASFVSQIPAALRGATQNDSSS